MEALYVAMPAYLPDKFTSCTEETRPIAIAWLVPISASEAEYVATRGWDEFEDRLVELDPDLTDLHRAPMTLLDCGAECPAQEPVTVSDVTGGDRRRAQGLARHSPEDPESIPSRVCWTRARPRFHSSQSSPCGTPSMAQAWCRFGRSARTGTASAESPER